jgi:hypothetical protein
MWNNYLIFSIFHLGSFFFKLTIYGILVVDTSSFFLQHFLLVFFFGKNGGRDDNVLPNLESFCQLLDPCYISALNLGFHAFFKFGTQMSNDYFLFFKFNFNDKNNKIMEYFFICYWHSKIPNNNLCNFEFLFIYLLQKWGREREIRFHQIIG